MKIKLLSIVLLISIYCFSQENKGQIIGDFNLSMQSYQEDSLIGATAEDEVVLSNAYLNLHYSIGNFRTGLRYESYLNALADYDPEFQGNGIAFRYATYKIDNLEITAGNYYEQLGSGLIFRSYEEKGLGIDNAMDGVRLRYDGVQGVFLKGFIGKSRTHFTYSDAIFRGVDGEVNINDVFKFNKKTKAIFGASFVSRYHEREGIAFKIPQNVGAYSTRLNILRGNWDYYAEFAYKINDPKNVTNETEINYASGNAFKNSITYSKRGFGFSAELHRIDNMAFKSDRDKDDIEKAYWINYIPTLSKQHTYSLLALYPYATQYYGEIGIQSDIFIKFKKGSMLGGKYGTKMDLNYSRMSGLSGDYGSSYKNSLDNYSPKTFDFGQELYFQDINLEIYKKINKKIKTTHAVSNQTYNRQVSEGKPGMLNSTILVSDISYKIKQGHTLRIELQTLRSEETDNKKELAEGDWSMGLIEYTVSPSWSFTLQDLYNWGNEDITKQLHYINTNISYSKGSNRFEIGYGKKREGIFCAGGVCKTVPASNGFTLNITSSF